MFEQKAGTVDRRLSAAFGYKVNEVDPLGQVQRLQPTLYTNPNRN